MCKDFFSLVTSALQGQENLCRPPAQRPEIISHDLNTAGRHEDICVRQVERTNKTLSGAAAFPLKGVF